MSSIGLPTGNVVHNPNCSSCTGKHEPVLRSDGGRPRPSQSRKIDPPKQWCRDAGTGAQAGRQSGIQGFRGHSWGVNPAVPHGVRSGADWLYDPFAIGRSAQESRVDPCEGPRITKGTSVMTDEAEPEIPEEAPAVVRQTRWSSGVALLERLVVAIRAGDDAMVESAVLALSKRSRWLAPLGMLVGAFVMLFQGVKLLFSNWRLTLVQILPAMWIWAAMIDLKAHVFHGKSFHVLRGPLLIPIILVIASITAAAVLSQRRVCVCHIEARET